MAAGGKLKHWIPSISREVFEGSYCARSKISREYYNEWFVTMPCNCGEGCDGWAAIRRDFVGICDHIELSAPTVTEYMKWELSKNRPNS